jgi:hypothetical protein
MGGVVTRLHEREIAGSNPTGHVARDFIRKIFF